MTNLDWPESLNICGKTYTVVYCSTREEVSPEGDCWGIHLPAQREIRVFDAPDARDTLDTVFHELTHAIFIEMKALTDMLAEGKEEVFTHEFASVLTDTLIRNGFLGVE